LALQACNESINQQMRTSATQRRLRRKRRIYNRLRQWGGAQNDASLTHLQGRDPNAPRMSSKSTQHRRI
ncbi:hypothetical protein ACPPTR_01890, partial [Ralstonia pseudosolanacearum]|uniref:hypothetical protein n=1 Tax=Ralstonia pseudosolanacearum TaxID=1310165 RepID=UPI003C7E9027